MAIETGVISAACELKVQNAMKSIGEVVVRHEREIADRNRDILLFTQGFFREVH